MNGRSLRTAALTYGGIALLSLAAAAQAADGDRSKLMGVWETGDGRNVKWVLEPTGQSLHVTYAQAGQKLADFECDTTGRECTTKESGRAAKVSLYFNGAILVELETKGPDIVKRRFTLSGSGEEMDVELIPVSSKAKAETIHFKRAATPPSN